MFNFAFQLFKYPPNNVLPARILRIFRKQLLTQLGLFFCLQELYMMYVYLELKKKYCFIFPAAYNKANFILLWITLHHKIIPTRIRVHKDTPNHVITRQRYQNRKRLGKRSETARMRTSQRAKPIILVVIKHVLTI